MSRGSFGRHLLHVDLFFEDQITLRIPADKSLHGWIILAAMEGDWPGLIREDDPDFHDPRFQRRIVTVKRPIPIVSNMHDATLECGHSPLLVGDNPEPKTGMMIFCGDCRDEFNGRAERREP